MDATSPPTPDSGSCSLLIQLNAESRHSDASVSPLPSSHQKSTNEKNDYQHPKDVASLMLLNSLLPQETFRKKKAHIQACHHKAQEQKYIAAFQQLYCQLVRLYNLPRLMEDTKFLRKLFLKTNGSENKLLGC